MRWAVPFSDRLTAELGPVRRARELGSSPRSRVWHAELPGAEVLVKQIIGTHTEPPPAQGGDPNLIVQRGNGAAGGRTPFCGQPREDGAAERFAREVTALLLAARIDPPLAPRLIGTDPGRQVMVLEYLTDQGPPEDWIVAYAEGLARLHAATGPADAGTLPPWSPPEERDVDAFLSLAAALDVPVHGGVRSELIALVERFRETTAYSFLHGDPCPGNDLYTADGVRFVDFEQASLGDGLVELAYLRIGFPTCWCVTEVPPTLLSRAEATYRATWHAITGLEPRGNIADACAAWLIRGDALVERAHRGTTDRLSQVLHKDWSWGTVTARQRLVHRLGIVARSGSGPFPDLCAAMRLRMLARWPGLRPPPRSRPR